MFEGCIYKFELNMQVSQSRRFHVNIKDDKCKIMHLKLEFLRNMKIWGTVYRHASADGHVSRL